MPSARVPLTVAASGDADRRHLASELAATAVDLRDPDAAEAVADLVAAVHAQLVRPVAARS